MPVEASAQPEGGEATADDVQLCADSYEQAQVTRNEGRLVEAQQHLRICVQDSCPDFVKNDCGLWLSELKRDIPSVVFSVVDSKGQELTDVKVTVDGVPVTLDGKPMELDPGQREVSYEYGGETKTEKVAIRQGEKNRVVRLEVVTDKDTDGDGVMDSVDQCPGEVGSPPDGCPAEQALPPAAQSRNGLRLGAYVAWGVGGAGLLTGSIFGLMGSADDEAARKECPVMNNDCTEERKSELVDGVESQYLIANIGWGVGIAGAVTGTVLFFLSEPGKSSEAAATVPVNVGVAPIDGGGFLSVSGGF